MQYISWGADMDTARCTLNGRTYTAIEFSQLPAHEIAALRHDLICGECEGPGYYRKPSRSGHGACFGARPHADHCQSAVRTEDPWGECGDEVVMRMEADQTRIILNLGRANGRGDGAGRIDEPGQRGGGRRFVGGDAPGRTQIQRNPEKLLKMLVSTPSFNASEIIIATGHGDYPARSYFVPIVAADRALHTDMERGFWGVLDRTNVWNGLRIFNRGGHGSLGFEFHDALIQEVMQRYSLATIEEIVGKHVLFIGKPRITTGDSFMMSIINSNHVALADPLRP